MTEQELESIRRVVEEAVEPAIKKYVNGKIDNLKHMIEENADLHRADMEEIKPFIQAKAGLSVLFKMFLSLGAVATAWLTIKGVFN